ncbi:MAG: AarF/ABC1/UbiB kinase family protein [Acidobacteria bacterium]|nr:AarF/ABC1/UbiB kinase family protein [Acidobacteriota bacterium]
MRAPAPSTTGPPAERPFEVLVERPPAGLLRRFLVTQRHLTGLLLGGLVAWVRHRPAERRHGFLFALAWLLSWPARLLVRRDLRREPFPVQLRRRLELLGPTYIKLGQVLSLRRDILPASITDELAHLLDRLPVVSFERFLELVEADLGRPVQEVFFWIDEEPLGSASIAQIHRATTSDGEQVILKVVKPGIRETLRRDALLLKAFGSMLEIFLARYRPRTVIDEFVDYTFKEVDLRREADNAEVFANHFRDQPDVVFPRIYRRLSGRDVLCMEFLDGIKPNSPEAVALPLDVRERIVRLGAEAIIRMLYRDGFFHADLHPANLLLLPGPKAGFIDLGMVGRFDDALRRTLLNYFYCLVHGDADSAARYLTSVAEPGPGADPHGFRRELVEISQRWHGRSSFEGISLGQLILESVNIGGEYRMYFPVEMVLMVKALVTFEGVGQILMPGLDVVAISRQHIQRIFLEQFSPLRLLGEAARSAPDLVEAVSQAPMLVHQSLKALDQMTTQRPRETPLAGIRGTLFGGFSLLAGAILVAAGAPWPLSALLFGLGVLVALRPGKG